MDMLSPSLLQVPTCHLPESDGRYPVVAQLNERWRVIECRDRIQSILQYRASAETYSPAIWRGRSYCRTREALVRCGIAYSGELNTDAAAVITALPGRIGGGR